MERASSRIEAYGGSFVSPGVAKGGDAARRSACATSWFQEEAGGFFKEQIQAIVMHPMSGAWNLHQAMIFDGRGALVGLGIWQPALDSPKQQDGAGDFGINRPLLFDVVAIGRHRAHVIIEFPGE